MSTTAHRITSYLLLSGILSVGFLIARDISWVGSQTLHTLMEVLATALALFVGILALIRHYTKPSNIFLLVGAGFLGTAFLDGYHALVTSALFDQLFPSPPLSLAPWSWNASRIFLSIFMVLSWLGSVYSSPEGKQRRIAEWKVYWGAGLFTIASFLFFALYPLPRAYYPELVFGRPSEMVAAALFLIALVGYLQRGAWKKSHFEHWLIMSLIVGCMSQALFMSTSYHLYDTMFDTARLLRIMSYLFTLTGLLISMFFLFKQAEEGKEQLSVQNAALQKTTREAEETASQLANQAAQLEKMNELMIGRELRMIELKKRVKELEEGDDAS